MTCWPVLSEFLFHHQQGDNMSKTYEEMNEYEKKLHDLLLGKTEEPELVFGATGISIGHQGNSLTWDDKSLNIQGTVRV